MCVFRVRDVLYSLGERTSTKQLSAINFAIGSLASHRAQKLLLLTLPPTKTTSSATNDDDDDDDDVDKRRF